MTQAAIPDDTNVADSDETKADKFAKFYADWLSYRALQVTCEGGPDDPMAEAVDGEWEAMRQMIGNPIGARHQLWCKFEVLERLINGNSNWTHNPEVAMLGSLKADLLRLLGGES